MISRRAFIKAGGLTLFGIGMGGVPGFVARAAYREKLGSKKILVCIFQRGAMDGLMAVSPFTDPHLKASRPDLFLSASGSTPGLTDLDGTFGLHHAFNSFVPLFKEGRLAIVHGMGSPNPTRSHFDAQDYMESGTPFNKGTASGWLNRAAKLTGHDASPFAAVSLTSSMPRSLYGDHPALAVQNLKDFAVQVKGDRAGAAMAAKSFEDLYDQASSDLLKEKGSESFEAMRMIGSLKWPTSVDAPYPASPLGMALKQIAVLIKSDVGLEIAFAESTGWDTHFNQGTLNGPFARNASDFSKSISAFWEDLKNYQDQVLVMTMTEFGRTVKQNGTRGTDHGRASCSFILGNHVKGGKVYGTVPSLAVENLEDGRDLPVTTDFRSVFNEVAAKHLQLKETTDLFPGWKGNSLGILPAR